MKELLEFLNKKVYFVEVKNKVVAEGRIAGVNVSESGYALLSILVQAGAQNKVIQMESKHVFYNFEDAEKRLNEIKPFQIEAEKDVKAANERLEILRRKIIGDPTFLGFANEIAGKVKEGLS